MSSYKSYQQVISLSIRPNNPGKVKKAKLPKQSPKLRTKTGCLTCRKRKKKCDENTVDGKCQGCTRNFLDCSWPVFHQLKQQDEAKLGAPVSFERKSSISSECSDSSDTSNLSLSHGMTSPTDCYPSPRSPALDDMPIKLPPLRFLTKSNPQPLEPLNKFVITSVNQDRLCSIKQ